MGVRGEDKEEKESKENRKSKKDEEEMPVHVKHDDSSAEEGEYVE
jgi:hypothetical protein